MGPKRDKPAVVIKRKMMFKNKKEIDIDGAAKLLEDIKKEKGHWIAGVR